jgi:hypothetical protein
MEEQVIDMFIPTMGGRDIVFYTQNGDVDSGFTAEEVLN